MFFHMYGGHFQYFKISQGWQKTTTWNCSFGTLYMNNRKRKNFIIQFAPTSYRSRTINVNHKQSQSPKLNSNSMTLAICCVIYLLKKKLCPNLTFVCISCYFRRKHNEYVLFCFLKTAQQMYYETDIGTTT